MAESDTPDRRSPAAQIRACRLMLAETFPAAFARPGGEKRPLAIGIDRMILERLPEHPRWLLKDTLGDYCGSQGYLACLVEGAARVDLNGQPCGHVDAGAAAHAARKLKQARGLETARARIAALETTLDALLQAISDDEVESPEPFSADRPVHSARLRAAAAEAEAVLGRIPAGESRRAA